MGVPLHQGGVVDCWGQFWNAVRPCLSLDFHPEPQNGPNQVVGPRIGARTSLR